MGEWCVAVVFDDLGGLVSDDSEYGCVLAEWGEQCGGSSVDVYASADGALVEIIDATGVVAVSSDGAVDAGTNLSSSAEVISALAGVPASGRDANVFVAVPVLSGANTVGAVRVAYPGAVIDERANSKLGGLVLVGLISLLAAVIAALFMASTLVRPLRRLQRSKALDWVSPSFTTSPRPAAGR